jgi:hypothetical protein
VPIRPWLLLVGGALCRKVSAPKHPGLPCVRRQGMRGDVLGRWIAPRPDGRMVRPERRPNCKGVAPSQQLTTAESSADA